LILGIPIVLALQLLIVDWTTQDFNILFWSFLANGFAILEHFNYYNKQLMVDNAADFNYIIRNKKLKTASLAKDLRENSF